MKRVVVLGDSLSMPRKEGGEFVKWNDTWAYQVQKDIRRSGDEIEVLNYGARARSIKTIITHDFHEQIVLTEPQVVVLQIGVVDAAPRILSLREKRFLNRTFFPGFLRRRVIAYRKKHKSRITANAPLKRVYTSPSAFSETLDTFDKMLEEKYEGKLEKLIVIPIVADLSIMEENSPSYGENIRLYNLLLEEFCNSKGHIFLSLPDNFWSTAANYCLDGYHLSAEGNSVVAEIIKKHLT